MSLGRGPPARALLGALLLIGAAPHAGRAEAAPAEEPWAVVGRVVDETRRPAAGAEVAVCVGEREVYGKSATDGAFRIACDSPPPDQPYAAIRAAAGETVGTASVRVDPGLLPTADAHTLVLRPGAPFEVTVRGPLEPVRDARVFATVDWEGPMQDPWGPKDRPWAGWAFRATTDANGVARFPRVPPGDARVLAFADGPRRGETRVEVGESGGSGNVALEPARDVGVTVVDERRGLPIRGAFVGVERRKRAGASWQRGDALDSPLSSSPTDEVGYAVLRSLPIDEGFVLYAFGTGWVWPGVADTSAMLEPRLKVLTISVPAVERLTAVLGPDRPTQGTRVRLLPQGGGVEGWRRSHGIAAQEAVVDADRLALLGRYVEPFGAVAVLPDGRRANALFLPRSADPLAFVPPARLEVVLRDGADRPASRVAVRVFDRRGRNLDRVEVTDPEGHARFEGLLADDAEIVVMENVDFVEPQRWGRVRPRSLGHVDLRSRDARVAAVIPSKRDAVLRVSWEGRPGLPPRFALRVVQFGPGFVGSEPPDTTIDAERGEVRFSAYRPVSAMDALQVTLRSPVCAPSVAWLREETPGGRLVADLRCEPGGSLTLAADLPRDREWSPLLQIRENGEWKPVYDRVRDPLPDETRAARRVWKNLWAAEYRVLDELSGVATDVVPVAAGEAKTAHLDLQAVPRIVPASK